MEELLPWHSAQWQLLVKRLHDNALPHALLISGPAGLGKNSFALAFAQAMLCDQRNADGGACGNCRGCRLNRAQTHPDLVVVNIPEDKKGIGIDQIREISDYITLKSQYGGYKIVIISPADKLNRNAANSLLKTLEEPPAWSTLMLITAQPTALPATVRSRCQQISFCPPPAQLARAWLADKITDQEHLELALGLAEGAPLAAVGLAQGEYLEKRRIVFGNFQKIASGQADPVAVAAEWLKFDPKTTIYWLYGWVTDMIRLKTGNKPAHIVNSDLLKPLQELAGQYSPRMLFRQLERVTEAWRFVEGQINTQLLLEDLLIAWADGPGNAKREPI